MQRVPDPSRGHPTFARLAVGPNPASRCAKKQGVWASDDQDILATFQRDPKPSWAFEYDADYGFRDFECVDDAQTWAVDASGGLSKRRDGRWNRTPLTEKHLTSIEQVDGTTYIAGRHGAWFEGSDGAVESVGDDAHNRSYGDLWVSRSETRAVLTADTGLFYRKGEDDWVRMPTPELGDGVFRAGGGWIVGAWRLSDLPFRRASLAHTGHR